MSMAPNGKIERKPSGKRWHPEVLNNKKREKIAVERKGTHMVMGPPGGWVGHIFQKEFDRETVPQGENKYGANEKTQWRKIQGRS